MKQLTEHSLAKAYLIHREKNYSITYILRRVAGQYVFRTALLLLIAMGALTMDTPAQRGACLFGVGMVIGSYIRDVSWYRQMKALWPLTKKFIDWQKVEAIAKQDQ